MICYANAISRYRAYLRGAIVAAVLSVTGITYAQTTGQEVADPTLDHTLSWRGITLYGTVDLGLQHDTHSAPISDYYPGGTANIVQKNSNHSVTGITPNNMSQSRIGVQGKELLPLEGDWSAVFKLETFFNPQSGELSDGLKSLVQNNGRPLPDQNTNVDSSVAGQIFQQAFAGMSSPMYGTVTFGRQNTLFADGVAMYDPQGASQAFSVVGVSGTSAGAGDTQDRKFDESLKYNVEYHGARFGIQYKFNQATGAANTAVEAQVGGDFMGLSVDAYYVKVRDAVSVIALSAAQVSQLTTVLNGAYSVSNSLSGTISDNTTFALAGRYSVGPIKLFAAYEHIIYRNPSTPLPVGFNDIGNYTLAFVNNAAYPSDRVLQVYWAGAKYTLHAGLDLVVGYYGYRQNSYASGANVGCTSAISSACSGNLDGISFSADYRMTKRFDFYGGALWTEVKNGLASGYLNRININPTVGARYKF